MGKTFRISLKSGFYPCTGNEVKPVLNGKHVKPIISMMKTRWIISFARLPVSVKNPNAAPVEGNIVPELIGTNNSDKQIGELDDICKLFKINKHDLLVLPE